MASNQLVFLAAALVSFGEPHGAGVGVERKHDAHAAVDQQIAAADRHLNRRPWLCTALRFVAQKRAPDRFAIVVGIERVHGNRAAEIHRHNNHVAVTDWSRHESAA